MQLTLKQARERKGWTLAEASTATGLDKSTLSRLERGQHRPSYDTVQAIERGFGLKPGALVFPVAEAA